MRQPLCPRARFETLTYTNAAGSRAYSSLVRRIAASLADDLRNTPPEAHKLECEDHGRALLGQ